MKVEEEKVIFEDISTSVLWDWKYHNMGQKTAEVKNVLKATDANIRKYRMKNEKMRLVCITAKPIINKIGKEAGGESVKEKVRVEIEVAKLSKKLRKKWKDSV